MDVLGELWLRLPPSTMDIGDGEEKVRHSIYCLCIYAYVCMFVRMLYLTTTDVCMLKIDSVSLKILIC